MTALLANTAMTGFGAGVIVTVLGGTALWIAALTASQTIDSGLATLDEDGEAAADERFLERLREWGEQAELPPSDGEFDDLIRPLVTAERPARLRTVPLQRKGDE